MSDSDLANEDLTRPSLGDHLRGAREAKGLSLVEAAERLHLRREQVDALESSQFDRIKGDVFVRGYLKAYARLLDLNADEVVAQYDRLIPAKFWRSPELKVDPPGTALPPWLPVVAVGSVVVIIAVLLALWLLGESKTKPGEQAAVEHSAVSAATGVESSAAATTETPGAPVISVSAAIPVVAASASASGAVPAALPQRLTMHFSADCWVEVRDASRKLLAADLKHAGDTLVLDGEPPYRVVLGYVPGVVITLGGKPVSVSTEPGKQSAKLTIGT